MYIQPAVQFHHSIFFVFGHKIKDAAAVFARKHILQRKRYVSLNKVFFDAVNKPLKRKKTS